MILNDTFVLANGVAIPKLGLGTWRIDDTSVAQIVHDAAGIGYRHFDTAQAYGNERGVGEGLRASGVPRDDLFVTTKLAAESKNYADARAASTARPACTAPSMRDRQARGAAHRLHPAK